MRLFVVCPLSKNRIYLTNVASSKSYIPESFSVTCPYDSSIHDYEKRDVQAEPETGSRIGGAVLGSIIGLAGGPLGLLIGGLLGAFVGDRIDTAEEARTQYFNEEKM